MTSNDQVWPPIASYLRKLESLARRFAPPGFPEDIHPEAEGKFHLRWWHAALAAALHECPHVEKDLSRHAEAAWDDDQLLFELWERVAKLKRGDLRLLIGRANASRETCRLHEPGLMSDGQWAYPNDA